MGVIYSKSTSTSHHEADESITVARANMINDEPKLWKRGECGRCHRSDDQEGSSIRTCRSSPTSTSDSTYPKSVGKKIKNNNTSRHQTTQLQSSSGKGGLLSLTVV